MSHQSSDTAQRSLDLHEQKKGKIALYAKVPIGSRDDLSLAYTPGVAAVSSAIAQERENVWRYTARGNWVAVVSDGSAVLGLGNIGPEAALPVMEGKAVLFKEFANVDAFPICLATQSADEIIAIVKALAPNFGGINLEDISAPRCFEIEERLKRELDIPVFHDDQHGTAIVVLAGLINACAVSGRNLSEIKVAINGAGAAGTAITRLLLREGVNDIVVLDSQGILAQTREDLSDAKRALALITNPDGIRGSLADAVRGRDVFIGVSAPHIMTAEHIATMADDPIIFALANPVPEIMPEEAAKAGVRIMATGRSDYPNQINNVLAFPGIFRGALDARVSAITDDMKVRAAAAIAGCCPNPSPEAFMPSTLDRTVALRVAQAVRECTSVNI